MKYDFAELYFAQHETVSFSLRYKYILRKTYASNTRISERRARTKSVLSSVC